MSKILLSISNTVAELLRMSGPGRLLESTRDAVDPLFMRLGTAPLGAQIDGFVLRGFLRHRSFLEGIAQGDYESFYRRLYLASLRPGMTVVDAGAHIGLYSLLASRRVGPTGTILSFEPDPYNFQALCANIKRNRCKNVRPIQKALSDKVDRTYFYQNPSTISSSLLNRTGVGKCARIEVETTTLAHELGDRKIPSLVVKLDVEGAELFAVQGMKRILRSADLAVVFAEVNPCAINDGRLALEDLIGELHSLGFKVYFIDEAEESLVPTANLPAGKKGNLYCSFGSEDCHG